MALLTGGEQRPHVVKTPVPIIFWVPSPWPWLARDTLASTRSSIVRVCTGRSHGTNVAAACSGPNAATWHLHLVGRLASERERALPSMPAGTLSRS
jgi:hypothetical protein